MGSGIIVDLLTDGDQVSFIPQVMNGQQDLLFLSAQFLHVASFHFEIFELIHYTENQFELFELFYFSGIIFLNRI